jgi:hypothetical protein
VDSQIGALFVINSKVAGMDCFGRPDILEKTFMKMIEGYARVAADKFYPNIKLGSSKTVAMNILQMAQGVRVQKKGTAMLADGWRLKSERCSGYALAYDDRVLHLSVMAKNRTR